MLDSSGRIRRFRKRLIWRKREELATFLGVTGSVTERQALDGLRDQQGERAWEHYLMGLPPIQTSGMQTGNLGVEKQKVQALAGRAWEGQPDEIHYEAMLASLMSSLRAEIFYISPGLKILWRCGTEKEDIARLVKISRFVPRASWQLWIDGLTAGYEGDYVTACHRLVVRLEDAIRCHIKMQASQKLWHSIGDRLIQGEDVFQKVPLSGLKWLFFKPGEGGGSGFEVNVRNVFAHGLFDDSIEWDPLAAYLWWYAMQLVFMGAKDASRNWLFKASGGAL